MTLEALQEGFKRKFRVHEECYEDWEFRGVYLKRGMTVSIVLKGRGMHEIVCEFICFNPVFATFVLKCNNSIRIVKYSEIRYMSFPLERGDKGEKH